MFSNMKSTFGTPAPGTSFGLGASTSTAANPWSNSNNSQMFGKTGNTGFGQQTPAFGQPSTSSNTIFPFFPQTNSTGFGTTTTNQTAFGSNMFGQQQQQQPATNTLFGSNSFAQQKTGFGFGTQNQQQPTLFGQPTQPQNLLFQQSGTSNLFGNTNTFSAGTVGTTVKFCPVSGTDTMQKNNAAISINTKHHCITCMKEYEGKSLEELRFEDYQANRKGPQSQFGSTPFGNTPSMFGQTTENKPAFGQPTVGFNQMGGTAFGQQNQTFGMGNQQTSANNIFGKPPAFGATGSTSAGFGAFNTSSSVTNSFGTNQNKPFGAAAPLFGSTQAQQQTAPFGNNLFGPNNQSTTSSFFNKPAPTSGFGTGGFAFNQTPATSTSNLFQPPKPVFGLGQPTSTGAFGQTTSFGQTNPPTAFGTSTFGKQLTFGQPTSSFQIGGQSNLFSNTQQKPGSLLGTTGGGLFGTNNFGNTSSFGVSQPNVQPQAQGFSLEMIQESKNLNLLVGNQFGHSPFLTGLLPVDKSLSPTLCTTNPAEIKKMLENNKKVDENNSNHKVNLKLRPPKTQRDNLFEEANDEEINKLYKLSCKRLTLKKKKEETKESIFEIKSIYNDISAGNKKNPTPSPHESSISKISNMSNSSFIDQETSPSGKNTEISEVINVNKQFARHNLEDLINQEYAAMNKDISSSDSPRSTQVLMFVEKNSFNQYAETSTNFTETPKNVVYKAPEKEDSFNKKSNKSPIVIEDSLKKSGNNNGNFPRQQSRSVIENIENEDDAFVRRTGQCGIILNRSEYYTLPSIEELDKMIGEDGRCMVRGFTVGRRKYGNVYFPDELNVKNLNLDEIVHFRYKEINMYPDEFKKPPVGEGLNRRAQVTLDRVYPRVKETKEIIEDVEHILATKFPEQLVEISAKHGLKFVDYRPETGSWVFMVDHFSKYAFTESDEEDCELSTTKRNVEMTKVVVTGNLFNEEILPATIMNGKVVHAKHINGKIPSVKFDNPKHLFEHLYNSDLINRKNENIVVGDLTSVKYAMKNINDKESCLGNLEAYLTFTDKNPGTSDIEEYDWPDALSAVRSYLKAGNMSDHINASDHTTVVTEIFPGSPIIVADHPIPDKCFSSTDNINLKKYINKPSTNLNPIVLLSPEKLINPYIKNFNNISSENHSNLLNHLNTEKNITALYNQKSENLNNIVPEKQFILDHVSSNKSLGAVYSGKHGQHLSLFNLCPEKRLSSFNVIHPEQHSTSIDLVDLPSKHIAPNRIKFTDSDMASEYTDDEDLRQCDILHRSMEVDLEETFKHIHSRPSNENFFYHDTRIQTMKAAFFTKPEKISSASSVENFEVNTGTVKLSDRILNESAEDCTLSEYGLDRIASVVNDSEIEDRCYTDISVFNGKVGGVVWFQGFKHYNIGPAAENLHHNLVVRTLPFRKSSDQFKEAIERCIRIAQECSHLEITMEDELPTLNIKNDRSYLEGCFDTFIKAPNFDDDYELLYKDVWSLCNALWGFDKGHDPFVKRRLSSWLRTSLNNQVAPKRNFPDKDIEVNLEVIYQHLTCFNVKEAAEMAMEMDMPVLSMIISEINLTQKSKNLIKKQLLNWFTSNYADHISPAMSKIYLLLSGQPFYLDMNVCAKLDWKRAFGVHLWYLTDEGSPLEVAIDAYTCGFEQEGYAAEPKPVYSTEEESVAFDIRYELLKIYRSRIYQLSKALNPATYSNLNTDYQLSWLLLLFFRSLNVGLIDNNEENMIHTSFSTQLENSGLWELAIVPLLFIKDKNLKRKLVYNLLYKNFPVECGDETTELEAKLSSDLNIPFSWIEHIREHRRNDLSETASYTSIPNIPSE